MRLFQRQHGRPSAAEHALRACIIALVACRLGQATFVDCELFNIDQNIKVDSAWCANPPSWRLVYHNLPLLTAAYCFNNGTGICKLIAGQFEFYMNSWTQEYLGPVEASKYVDSFGLHKRVPVSYTPDGQVIHADRAINWSRYFVAGDRGEYNIMMATSFNWCIFAPAGNWPYKSGFLDHDNSTQIFFFNKQTCIYDPVTKKLQHYNTRFLSRSQTRLDYDYNPLIWPVEAENHRKVLFFHMRQHFRPRTWELKKNTRPNLDFFIQFGNVPHETPMLDGMGGFIRKRFYQNHTKLCLSDHYSVLKEQGNAELVPAQCGIEMKRDAVYGYGAVAWWKSPFLEELSLHSLPHLPLSSQRFWGVETLSHWEEANYREITFSATTAYPANKEHSIYNVISLYSTYYDPPRDHDYNEHFPNVHFDTYTSNFNGGGWDMAVGRRPYASTRINHLNYVDDFEYLPRCETVLVVFGPLYSEFPVAEFKPATITNVTAPLGSIYSLGLNEMVNTFFAFEDKIYFYHRTNFVAEHQYVCAGKKGALVEATKTGTYLPRHGPERHPIFKPHSPRTPSVSYREENIFADLGIYKGGLPAADAPDATQFPWSEKGIEPLGRGGLPWWLWMLILAGLLFLAGMVVLGLITFRRRQRRRRYLEKTRRSMMASSASGSSSGRRSTRSALGARSGGLPAGTRMSSATSRSKMPGSRSASRSRPPSQAASQSSASRRSSSMSGRSSGRAPSRRSNISAARPSAGSAARSASSSSQKK